MIFAPISVGELIDKITILEIKLENINDKNKIKNIEKELNILEALCNLYDFYSNEKTLEFKKHLKDINYKLWTIEDEIRIKESKKEFDKEFISLARSVYITNDLRAEVKKSINLFYKSNIIEEKFYG